MQQWWRTIISILVVCGLLLVIAGPYYFFKYYPYQRLTRVTFKALPGWDLDQHQNAFKSFQKSCVTILKNPTLLSSSLLLSQAAKQWTMVCQEAIKTHLSSDYLAKQFFEKWFIPYQVSNYWDTGGLFTGYYLPSIKARLKKNGRYTVPIYALPRDLVRVNLSLFNPDWADKTIIGQLKDANLFPYPDRAAINSGAIRSSAPVLAWSNNIVDVFFAEVQGSALLKLPHGRQKVIGYAGKNGRPYTAIGRWFLDHHIFNDRNSISMQSIREWLSAHPKEINTVLNENASYVFFRMLENGSALGSLGAPLTPLRSLAVDSRYIPLGVPMWVTILSATSDMPLKEQAMFPFQHLLIAQDTGGAIKGIVRGDIYFGPGKTAAIIAGHLKSPGKYWIFLPKNI